VTQTDNGKPAAVSIREMVTVVEQSPGLPSRPPFVMTIKLTGGKCCVCKLNGAARESSLSTTMLDPVRRGTPKLGRAGCAA
jgi:hypothetical protein